MHIDGYVLMIDMLVANLNFRPWVWLVLAMVDGNVCSCGFFEYAHEWQ